MTPISQDEVTPGTNDSQNQLVEYATKAAWFAHLIPLIGPYISPICTGILSKFQLKNLEAFVNGLAEEIRRLERLVQDKLDKQTLVASEFLRLARDILYEATWTVAENKRVALRNALLGLCTVPRSSDEARALYVRLLVGLTNEQVILLSLVPEEKEKRVSSVQLAKDVGMSAETTAMFCYDLARMGLIRDYTWDGLGGEGPGYWNLTPLGSGLVKYCLDLERYYQYGTETAFR